MTHERRVKTIRRARQVVDAVGQIDDAVSQFVDRDEQGRVVVHREAIREVAHEVLGVASVAVSTVAQGAAPRLGKVGGALLGFAQALLDEGKDHTGSGE